MEPYLPDSHTYGRLIFGDSLDLVLKWARETMAQGEANWFMVKSMGDRVVIVFDSRWAHIVECPASDEQEYDGWGVGEFPYILFPCAKMIQWIDSTVPGEWVEYGTREAPIQ